MKVYHRIFGDPPNKGFDNSIISSIGFPGGAKFTDAIKNIRLPRTKGKETVDGDFVIFQEAFEYQTISFGQPAVIHSMFAGKSSGGSASRPHGFTHIAAPKSGNAEHLTLDDISPAQLLQFDEPLTVREFWDIPKNTETWPVTDWEPPVADAEPDSAATGLPQEMAEALALRYWRAISSSFFSDSQTQQPVEICLSGETDGHGIIAKSKSFFASEIVPRLPKAALNILSMSAPAYQSPDSVQSFQPTALIFLFPDQEFEAHESFFDLRSRRFVPLDSWHTAFIRRVLGGEHSPGLEHAWETHRRHMNKTNPSHCMFLADYHVAYGMESIEHRRIDVRQAPHELLSQWRTLIQRLNKYHQIDLPLCQEMLKPVIQSALQQFAELGAAFPMNKEQLSFLFSQALAMNGGQEADDILQLIARHQAARMEPFFLSSLPWQDLPGKAAAVSDLMSRILTACYVKDPPNTAVLQALASQKLASICAENADCKNALERYIGLLAREHPEISVDLLPLARRYSDPTVILYNTANLLISHYVETAPGAEVCDDLKHLLAAANNPEIQGILDRYFHLLYVRCLAKPDVFLQTVQAIAMDMTGSVQTILHTAAETVEFLDAPLGEDDLGLLTVKLSAQIQRPEDVRQSLLAYAEAVIGHAMDTEFDWFAWLFGLDSLGDWLPMALRCKAGIKYLPLWMQRWRRLLNATEFSGFLSCVKGEYNDVFLQNESQYTAAYELLGDAGEAQLKQLLPLFRHVGDTRYVRAKYLEWLQSRAVYHWEQDFAHSPEPAAANGQPANAPFDAENAYWQRASQLRDYLAVCGEPLEALFTPNVHAAAQTLLNNIFSAVRLTTAGYEALFRNRFQQQPDDAFTKLWHQALVRAYARHYSETLTRSNGDLQELQALETVKNTIRAEQALLDSPQERYCQEVLRAAAFLTSLGTLNDSTLTRDTMRAVHILRQCMQDVQTHQPLLSLYRYCLQPNVYGRIGTYRYNARIAAGLICTCWGDNGFSLKYMAPILIGPGAVPVNPYAPESRKYLQAVVSLFDLLALFDPQFPVRLVNELTTDPEMAAYTSRLLAKKNLLYTYFPQCAPGYPAAEWQRRSPLYAWLTGNP